MNKTLKEVAQKLSKEIKHLTFEEDEYNGDIVVYYKKDVLLQGSHDSSWYGVEEFIRAEVKIIEEQNAR